MYYVRLVQCLRKLRGHLKGMFMYIQKTETGENQCPSIYDIYGMDIVVLHGV